MHPYSGWKFADVTDASGTRDPGSKTIGAVALDYDGDGRPDLYVTNYANEPNTLYRNVEGATFAESEREAFGGDHDPVLPLSKWGVAALDWDNDRKDDLAVSSGQILSRFFTVVGQWFNPKARNFAVGERSYAQRQFLFHNESAPGEFYVVPSYASGSWLPLHFGLGAATSARVTVRWPDGATEDLGELSAGAYRLRKGEPPTPLRAGATSRAASC